MAKRRFQLLRPFLLIFTFSKIILFSEVILLVLFANLLDYLEKIAPAYLEYDFDNSGPQIQFNRDHVEKVLIGLDPSLKLIEEGSKENVHVLITHHPLIFSEISSLNEDDLLGKKIIKLAAEEINLISLHTPFDLSPRGLSEGLAKQLELKETRPLTNPQQAKLLELTVFIPTDKTEEVIQALLEAKSQNKGPGSYSDSYYETAAKGHFRPLKDAHPRVGRPQERKTTQESRVELLISQQDRSRILSALRRAHPYEEPAFSLVESERTEEDAGLGRIGSWKTEKSPGEVKSFVPEKLDLPQDNLKISGTLRKSVSRIAVSPGAGGAALNPALNSDGDLFITGELDHHERLQAREEGLCVIEAGHFHTEKVFAPWLKHLLEGQFSSEDLKILLFREEDEGEQRG